MNGETTKLVDSRTTAKAVWEATDLLSRAGVDNPRREAAELLTFAMNCRREDLIRDPDKILDARMELIFNKAVELRSHRRPLSYITGESWFYGRQFKVNRAVLIPRPETEMLVDFAVEKASQLSKTPCIADIGTGSGCIAVTIALTIPICSVEAVDLSKLALKIAQKNCIRYGVQSNVSLHQGDLFNPLARGCFDVIVSNPPYIAVDDIAGLMPEVGVYEPRLALYEGAGDDGTMLHQRLLSDARFHLSDGGWIALEVGLGQAERVCSFAAQYGYKAVEKRRDFAGIDRVVVAQWTS